MTGQVVGSELVRLRQKCLLSPNILSIVVMDEALDVHEDSVGTGGRFITNFRFADDISGLFRKFPSIETNIVLGVHFNTVLTVHCTCTGRACRLSVLLDDIADDIAVNAEEEEEADVLVGLLIQTPQDTDSS